MIAKEISMSTSSTKEKLHKEKKKFKEGLNETNNNKIIIDRVTDLIESTT